MLLFFVQYPGVLSDKFWHVLARHYETENNSIRALYNTIMGLCELAIRRNVRSGDVTVRRQLDVTVEMVRAGENALAIGRRLVR